MIKTKRPFMVSPLWRIIVFTQALLIAWIGFTHGSGIEMFLQKSTFLSEKAILSWDRNVATLIAILALSILWRPTRVCLGLLSLLYLGESILATRFGGFVDIRFPWLAHAAQVALPLAPIALQGRRWVWVLRILQTALVFSVGYYVWAFLNASPYYLDVLARAFSRMGHPISNVASQWVLLSLGILLLINLFWSSQHWVFLTVFGILSLGLMSIQFLNFGLPLFPEACLKGEIFAAALAISMAERGRKRGELSF